MILRVTLSARDNDLIAGIQAVHDGTSDAYDVVALTDDGAEVIVRFQSSGEDD